MDTQVQKKAMAGKVVRASRTLGQLWQVPTFALGLAAFLLVAATAPLRQDTAVREFDNDLDQLCQAVSNKQENIQANVSLAESLLQRLNPKSRKAGQVYFLAGSVYQRLAEQSADGQVDEIRKKAIAHLDKARSLGLADEDTPVLLYRLGVLLYESGTNLEQALDLIASSVNKGSDDPARGYALLAQGYLRLPRPDLEAALTANQKQLQLAETDAEILEARLFGGDLLVRLGRTREALGILEPIGPKAPKAPRIRARLLQTQCCQQDNQWQEAVRYWKALLPDAAEVPGGKAHILYHLALCYYKSEPANLAQAQAIWRQTVNLGGEEGQAAGLRLAEMHLTAPAFEPAWGLTDLTGALVKVHSPHDYKNKLVTLIHVREIFETVWSLFQEKHDFTHAEQLAELYKKVALRGVAEERLAQSLQARGEELEDKASKGSGPLVNSWKEQAREQFLKAGAAFESAANARPIIQQAATLEQSAACFSRAKDFTKAVAAWKRFVQIHNSDEALAGGCMALADAYRALGQMDLAREALYKCIEYPNTPFAFRARYQLALEAIDQGKLDQAEKILEQNVREVNGPVDREAHGKSLYQYAGLLLQRKNYDKAPLFLDLATREYPDDPKAWSARDQLGLCYRQLAKEEDRKLQEKGVEEKNAAYRSEKRRGYLGNAAKVYQKLADDLEKLSTLSAKQQSLLGKSQVAVADIYRAMAEYGEAIRRYKILLEKYHGKKEELLACAGIWYSAKELYTADQTRRDALEDTRVALAKTLADLDNMTPDSEAFQGPDGRSREIWLNWLRNAQRDINDQIQNPVPPPAQTTTPP